MINMMDTKNNKIDEQIKNALMQETNNLELNNNLFNKIKVDIYNAENKVSQKGNLRMKRNFITGALCLSVASATVVAASYIWSSESYSSNQLINSLPVVEEIESKYGFSPKFVDEFSNGFKFSGYAITNNTINKDTKQISFEGLSLNYEKGNDTIYLSIEPLSKEFINYGDNVEIIKTIDDINLYYVENLFKVVPPGYVLTPEEEKQQLAGELTISFGDSDGTVETYQYMSWTEDGNLYSLSGFEC
ncbi:hypothetical protein AN396_06805, partial [Candidatus Epulonipiscium fishelsonii]